MPNISKKSIIRAGTRLGKDCIIEDFVIIGVPPRGYKDGELETVIGDGAHIRSHTVIYAGNKIGRNFATGNKVNIREFNLIGDNVSIGTLSVIEHHVEIGNGVRIHSQAFIPELTILEDECWIGPNVVITNSRYPKSPNSKDALEGVVVKRGAILGANATIMPGIVIGEDSLVGAGSVVTKDVSPKTVVVGNPARVINQIENLPY